MWRATFRRWRPPRRRARPAEGVRTLLRELQALYQFTDTPGRRPRINVSFNRRSARPCRPQFRFPPGVPGASGHRRTREERTVRRTGGPVVEGRYRSDAQGSVTTRFGCVAPLRVELLDCPADSKAPREHPKILILFRHDIALHGLLDRQTGLVQFLSLTGDVIENLAQERNAFKPAKLAMTRDKDRVFIKRLKLP